METETNNLVTDDAREAFDALVPVYVLWAELMAGDTEDVSFYRELANASTGVVADLGCGWGRMTGEIFPDYGVDFSTEAIAEAELRSPTTNFIVSDLVSYELPERSTFSYAAGNTFDTTLDDGKLESVFRNIHRQTAPGGHFAFDALALDFESIRRTAGLVGLHTVTGTHAVQTIYAVASIERREYSIRHVLETLDTEGTVVSRRYFPALTAKCRGIDDYLSVFAATGWTVGHRASGFADEPLMAESNRLVWVLECT